MVVSYSEWGMCGGLHLVLDTLCRGMRLGTRLVVLRVLYPKAGVTCRYADLQQQFVTLASWAKLPLE